MVASRAVWQHDLQILNELQAMNKDRLIHTPVLVQSQSPIEPQDWDMLSMCDQDDLYLLVLRRCPVLLTKSRNMFPLYLHFR